MDFFVEIVFNLLEMELKEVATKKTNPSFSFTNERRSDVRLMVVRSGQSLSHRCDNNFSPFSAIQTFTKRCAQVVRFAYHAVVLSVRSPRNAMCHYLNLFFFFFFISFSVRSLQHKHGISSLHLWLQFKTQEKSQHNGKRLQRQRQRWTTS